MLSVGCCGVAGLQMKFGHMDDMHCIRDGTSILVKIKSVALYNCRTVYLFYSSTHPLSISSVLVATLQLSCSGVLANSSPELIISPFPYPKLASILQHLLNVGMLAAL
jgi:hypothetical protein